MWNISIPHTFEIIMVKGGIPFSGIILQISLCSWTYLVSRLVKRDGLISGVSLYSDSLVTIKLLA